MNWPNRYSHPEVCETVAGSGIKVNYSPVFDEHGIMSLEESGKDDFYAYIQSFKDQCDINKIYERFCQGDSSALSQVQGMYADFSDAPKTYSGWINLYNDLEGKFSSLPLDVREKFGFSYERWLSGIGTSEWLSAMQMVAPAGSPLDTQPVQPGPAPVVPSPATPGSDSTATS